MRLPVNEIVNGRKTFFITPDTSLMPELYLEDFFVLGYECYFIENDKRVSLDKKIDIIISLFKDVIIFFNIDYNSSEIDWYSYIKNLTASYGNKLSIGVLYTKRQNKEERARIEKKYLFDLGICCGCIQLDYQKKNNFILIEKILYANQAQGRRKNIRALCPSSCTYSLNYNGNQITGTIQDVSLSHFTACDRAGKLNVKLYEKIRDIHINVQGYIFRADAVLLTERQTGSERIFVFAFTDSAGHNGLDQRIKNFLVSGIYKLMEYNCINLLNEIYTRASKTEDISNILEFNLNA